MIYNLVHKTIYEYAEPVTVSHHAARVEPRTLAHQQVENFSLNIGPTPAVSKPRVDFFGNQVCGFSIQEIHQRLEVTARSRVNVAATTLPAPELSPDWEGVVKLFSDPVSPEVVAPYQFVFDSPLLAASPELAVYTGQSFGEKTPLLVAVADFNRRIFSDFKYDPTATPGATPLAIAGLRSLGLPARYVSGYLRTHPPAGQARLVGADASHAWFAVFCPDVGWVDFDPTNNVLPAEEHIPLAFGRDYADVSPVSGVITGGGAHTVKVSVDVEPLD